MSDTVVVIPARWHSSRFPGKPLVPIAGRTMLDRVIALARRGVAGRDGVPIVVATDDARVADHASNLGCRAVLTDPELANGSERALAAARVLPDLPARIVNLQGDAPFLPAAAIAAVLDLLAEGAEVATPVVPLSWTALDALRDHKAREPFSGTTCVTDGDGRALWFSKQILPAIRGEARLRAENGAMSPVLRHLGLYGYSTDALIRFTALAEHPLERLEGLEQLRLIAAGIPITTALVSPAPIAIGGIDTPADVALAEAQIALHGDPLDE